MTSLPSIFIHKDNHLYWQAEGGEILLKLSLERFLVIQPNYSLPVEFSELLKQDLAGIYYDASAKNLTVTLADGTSTSYDAAWGRGEKLLENFPLYQTRQALAVADPIVPTLAGLKAATLKRIGEIAELKYKALIEGRETEATFLWYEKKRIASAFLETGVIEEQAFKIEAMRVAKLASDASVEEVYEAVEALALEVVRRYEELKTNSALIASERSNKREEVRLAADEEAVRSIDLYGGWPF